LVGEGLTYGERAQNSLPILCLKKSEIGIAARALRRASQLGNPQYVENIPQKRHVPSQRKHFARTPFAFKSRLSIISLGHRNWLELTLVQDLSIHHSSSTDSIHSSRVATGIRKIHLLATILVSSTNPKNNHFVYATLNIYISLTANGVSRVIARFVNLFARFRSKTLSKGGGSNERKEKAEKTDEHCDLRCLTQFVRF
jgi:hypothetical protein